MAKIKNKDIFIGWKGQPLKADKNAILKIDSGLCYIRKNSNTMEVIHTAFDDMVSVMCGVPYWQRINKKMFDMYLEFIKSPSDAKFNQIRDTIGAK